MLKSRICYLIIVGSLIFFISCPSKEVVRPTEPPQFDINTAKGLFQEGQFYLKFKNYDYAYRSFTALVEDFPDDELVDEAQYMIAEILSNSRNPNHDLESALEEYEKLVDDYPDSPYVKKAEKKIQQLKKDLERLK